METLRSFIGKGKEILDIYKIEATLIVISSCVAIISAIIFVATLQPTSAQNINNEIVEVSENEKTNDRIIIDIAGAVNKPGVYELSPDARLKDAITKANGISDQVDYTYFAQHINMARTIKDQEKIYIPNAHDNELKLLKEEAPVALESSVGLININTTSQSSLESLPGIGPALGQKIIDSRPYTLLEELIMRKIIPQNTYDKIKDLITI